MNNFVRISLVISICVGIICYSGCLSLRLVLVRVWWEGLCNS